MAETLANGTTIPQGTDLIHSSGVQAMRNLGGSVDGQLGNRYTKAQADALLAGKAASSHSHSVADVTGLQAALDATAYESGWRDVSGDLRLGWTGELHIRRIGYVVYWRCKDLLAGTGHAFYAPPAGMTTAQPGVVNMVQSLNIAPLFQLDSTGRLNRTYTAAALPGASWWTGEYVLPVGTPPPASSWDPPLVE